jgi:hypothetical protein
MSDLEPPQNNDEWARKKGLKRKCIRGHEYDPRIFNRCPICRKEEQEQEKRRQSEAKERKKKERKQKVISNGIVWQKYAIRQKIRIIEVIGTDGKCKYPDIRKYINKTGEILECSLAGHTYMYKIKLNKGKKINAMEDALSLLEEEKG